MKKTLKIIKIGIGIFLCSVVLYFIIPIAVDIYTSLQNYNKRIASRPDYTEITAPLPRDVIDDLCSKFAISPSDIRCVPNSVAYGPDFFEDIKSYFKGLPHQDQTYTMVQKKLGVYLVSCEEPDKEGFYSCTYDLRGDGIYPIDVLFTKDDFYYRILASTGGS